MSLHSSLLLGINVCTHLTHIPLLHIFYIHPSSYYADVDMCTSIHKILCAYFNVSLCTLIHSISDLFPPSLLLFSTITLLSSLSMDDFTHTYIPRIMLHYVLTTFLYLTCTCNHYTSLSLTFSNLHLSISCPFIAACCKV